MNKTKVAAGRIRKANRRRRNGTNGQRGNGASANGERFRGAVRDWRNSGKELDPAIQRYVDLYEFAPIAYVAFDRSGRVHDINLAASDLLDRKREFLVGSPFSLCVLAADLDLFLRHLARCRAGHRRVESNLRLKKHNGEQLSVILSSTSTTSLVADGAQLFQTAIVDLTERERVQSALRQSEARYRTLFDLVPIAVYACDQNGVIREYNRRAVELWGVEPGSNGASPKFCGSYKIYYPDGRFMPHEKCPMARVLRGEKLASKDLEILVERPDGECRHVIPAPQILLDERGNIAGAINCLYDITERKQIEERLAEQARLLDLSNDAILVRDSRGRIVYWNHGATELYGYKPEEAIGKVTHELLRTVLPESVEQIRKKIERDKRWSGELVHTRKDGAKIIVMSRWALDRDAHGKSASVLETNIDITREKNAEAELQRSKELLENLVGKRTKALRSANVELESEITHRKGLEGQILEISDREQERLGQELHDGLCQQLTAIGFLARATALRLKDHRVVQTEDLEKVAQLINSSVMDARNIARNLHKEEIEAAEFLLALEHLVDRKIWKTPCRLDLKTEVNIEDDKVASQLYRILREALVNANKHARASQIVLKVRRLKNELVFSVADDGVGLSRKPKEGQGLGFHIMQYRAQSIGARLEFESPKKGGACVACYLPLSVIE